MEATSKICTACGHGKPLDAFDKNPDGKLGRQSRCKVCRGKASASTISISEIDVTGRSRKHVGNIDALAKSIERIGLLHPIVVTPDKKLVVGRRRIEAFKKLGRKEIPANTARNLDELQLLLEAERDENTCREAYTPEEAVHLARQLRPMLEKLSKAAEISGKSADGKSGGRGKKNPRGSSPRVSEARRAKSQSAAAAGKDRRTVEKAEAVVDSGDRKLIDEMNRTGKVNGAFKKLVVAEKSAAIESEPPPLPDGEFRVIVADPPWHYEARGEDPSHRAANPYPSLSIDEIKALPVADRAHADCVLWLWTTNAHLSEAFGIVAAWGFTYKTLLTWGKNKMGTGDWLRGKTEHCLMAVRGKPTIRLTNQTTLLLADSGKHSEKPAEFYKLIDALCPGSKLEMFQRQPREGWIGHGDETEKVQ